MFKYRFKYFQTLHDMKIILIKNYFFFQLSDFRWSCYPYRKSAEVGLAPLVGQTQEGEQQSKCGCL